MIFGKALREWLPAALLMVLAPLALFLLARQVYQAGHLAGANGVHAQWAQQRATQATQLATDLLTQRQRAQALQDQLDALETTRQQENAHAQSENEHLRQRIRTGALRLSVPALAPACAPQLANADLPPAPLAAGGPAPARAELDPAAAEDLVAITQEGDAAIRDLNACIERHLTLSRPPDVQAR